MLCSLMARTSKSSANGETCPPTFAEESRVSKGASRQLSEAPDAVVVARKA